MSKKSGRKGIALYGSSIAITGVAYLAGTATLTVASGHGIVAGDRVDIRGVGGATGLNHDKGFTVQDVDATTIDVLISADPGTYTTGGVLKKRIELTGWEDTDQVGDIDHTDSSSGNYREHMPDELQDGSGSITGFIHQGTNPPPIGTIVDLELYESENKYSYGQAYLSSRARNVSRVGANAVTVTYNFQKTGAWADSDDDIPSGS